MNVNDASRSLIDCGVNLRSSASLLQLSRDLKCISLTGYSDYSQNITTLRTCRKLLVNGQVFQELKSYLGFDKLSPGFTEFVAQPFKIFHV